MELTTPIGQLPSVGPIYQRRLEKLAIATVEDLIYHFPFRYDDFGLFSKITTLQEGEVVTVQGKIAVIKNEYTYRRRFIQRATVVDDTGNIAVVWFNQPYLIKNLPAGTILNLSGEVSIFRKTLTLVSPEHEIVNPAHPSDTIHTARLVPIYPETYGISSKWIRNKIKSVLTLVKNEINEYLPSDIISRNHLMPLSTALLQIHFPENEQIAQKARERLAFDELFLMQLRSLLRKKAWESQRRAISFGIATHREKITRFWEQLPFELTNAQKRAVKEIFADLARGRAMNRLLEGDVGSGKTVVAAIGMYVAYLNSYQSVLMAPTEILANQHFETISKLLSPLGVKVGLVTGSKKLVGSGPLRVGKKRILRATAHAPRAFDILIGTHALLSEKLTLEKLAFIVIDEQHRFGVEQRGLLLTKGEKLFTPHVLTMTATPIPRTVALTMYGNLDLSYLDEMPKGRIPVKTWVVAKEKRENAYMWIDSQIKQNHAQVFIICPFIEESETLSTVRAATAEYERLKDNVFKNFSLGMLHGKMKTKEKSHVMEKFRNQKLDILVATPVVEVGIDIPGATIIVIEGGERFGLAQLHQLRGRVGRSNKQSYCILFSDSENPQIIRRLRNLERIQVGAELAELDLNLRGPGELTGVTQHGIPKLRIASFTNPTLIEKTKKEIILLLRRDPTLKGSPLLQDKLKTDTIKAIEPN